MLTKINNWRRLEVITNKIQSALLPESVPVIIPPNKPPKEGRYIQVKIVDARHEPTQEN